MIQSFFSSYLISPSPVVRNLTHSLDLSRVQWSFVCDSNISNKVVRRVTFEKSSHSCSRKFRIFLIIVCDIPQALLAIFSLFDMFRVLLLVISIDENGVVCNVDLFRLGSHDDW